MEKEIFALDIGTRKVMGIIARQLDDAIEILDVEAIEHPSRPMFDGQIHNIEEVAKTVRRLKEILESRQNKPQGDACLPVRQAGLPARQGGQPNSRSHKPEGDACLPARQDGQPNSRSHKKLEKVSVAVAGRNLLTFKSKTISEFDREEEITREMVKNLELQAIDNIISGQEESGLEFYCAGYSPVYYELNGNRISELIGHRGKSIACELIVTFLPRVVLNSMFAVLEQAGLTPVSVTLEPIAALYAIVPPEIRNLNILLVDIGAGTSDLALTKDGYIYGYGMVPEAGDEITEAISQILLVDFNAAETIKRSLDKKDVLDYEDIWGKKHKINSQNLIEKLSPRIKKLAEAIARTALELGEASPQAVIGVGGGSLTPHLIKELAVSFGLSQEQVGLRLPQAIKNIKDRTQRLTGPEAVTPIGIALIAANSLGLYFIELEVNHRKFRILDFQQKKDVLGALTVSGVLRKKRLYPRPGMAITCSVNGELKIIKGTLGKAARILRNGNPVGELSEKIENGDRLEFEEARDGENAAKSIGELLNLQPIKIIFNQEAVEILPALLMNERPASLDSGVIDRADIRILPLKIKDALRHKAINLENRFSERQILVNINGSPTILTQANFTLSLNGKEAHLNTEIKQNDNIEFLPEKPTSYKIKDIIDIPETVEKVHINVSGKNIEITVEPVQIFMNGRPARPDEFLLDGADIRVYHLKERAVILSEIFRYIDFDPRDTLGKRMKILVNDTPAGFTTPLVDGSKVRFLFEDRNEEEAKDRKFGTN